MVMLLIQHNTFFNLSDHLCPLIRNEFKGSEVARSFSCSRTKTAAIVNCFGDHFFNELISEMQNMPYSLMLDSSNDNNIQNMFPITVRIFDETFSRIMTKFLDMNLLEGRDASTADVMFESVDTILTENNVRWDHCMAIGLDNTNVNIGEHNSIKSRAKEKNENIVIAGCPCHVLHNASSKAAMSFSEVTGFDIEDHCVDVFYWFDKSGKRKSILKEYYQFCDTEYEEVIKFISTRWLCLELCINRELKKYEGLKSYFLSEDFPDARFKQLRLCYDDPIIEVYLLFYQFQQISPKRRPSCLPPARETAAFHARIGITIRQTTSHPEIASRKQVFHRARHLSRKPERRHGLGNRSVDTQHAETSIRRRRCRPIRRR